MMVKEEDDDIPFSLHPTLSRWRLGLAKFASAGGLFQVGRRASDRRQHMNRAADDQVLRLPPELLHMRRGAMRPQRVGVRPGLDHRVDLRAELGLRRTEVRFVDDKLIFAATLFG